MQKQKVEIGRSVGWHHEIYQQVPYLKKFGCYPPMIADPPHEELKMAVVIPCYNEPNLVATLESFKNCNQAEGKTEVIIVINAASDSPQAVIDQNIKTYLEAESWIKSNSGNRLRFFLIAKNDFPPKHAGVGLARKTGMDEAVFRLSWIGREDGIIICFDADASCRKNFLTAVEEHFQQHPNTTGCSIHFEHPVEGTDFSPKVYEGIVQYELFLRYYRQGLLYAGHPYAYHTIGSSMAVRSEFYQKQGGMNKRKAGEDFYFLQKIIGLGNFSELTNTTVFPSARPSDRVPFGTGKAINDWLASEDEEMTAYDPRVFSDLKAFCELSGSFYNCSEETFNRLLSSLPESVSGFLSKMNFKDKLNDINKSITSGKAFDKRFWHWFNGFMALKYVHFFRDHYYPLQPITAAANKLLHLNQRARDNVSDPKELLEIYREMDRETVLDTPPKVGYSN